MTLQQFSQAAYRAFTTAKAGPTLYDLCDPLLAGAGDGDAHLRKFYKKAIANPALRLVLARAGLPQLRDKGRFEALSAAITAARDDATPDWTAIGRPLAALIDEFPQQHPVRPAAKAAAPAPAAAEVERIIKACARHLLDCFSKREYIPAYAAFKLVGDPDFRGRDLLTALAGLNARTYKNATLLFNLARVFVLANPHILALINPPWRGLAEPMWDPVQIRHRTAYYDAFFAEALMDFIGSGLATAGETAAAGHAVADMVRFCLETSREGVRIPHDGKPIDVITALVPLPHSRMSKFFWQLKSDLGFGLYVPDCDTTVCSFSAATQFGSDDPILQQPLLDFLADYQVGNGNHDRPPTVTINDNIDYEGAIVSWIENAAGDRPFGNDLDPTLNLDVLETSFRNHERWQIVENPGRLRTLRGIVRFQDRLVESGGFADPRSHIYYLPELYVAYFGRCYAAFKAMPPACQAAIDPDGRFEAMRGRVLAYVRDDLMAAEMNPFDAALALLALAKLGAEPTTFAPALACIARGFGEGRGRAPFKAYEWNKMKTPTRILVGGPEVTSAFVLSALVHARTAARRRT
ncbi:MAG TPA: hypothetical protein VE914_15000 [Candidatus Angelobacter sp.]|nr:hypothetical protein [Candidatus Angelobacter sp.]